MNRVLAQTEDGVVALSHVLLEAIRQCRCISAPETRYERRSTVAPEAFSSSSLQTSSPRLFRQICAYKTMCYWIEVPDAEIDRVHLSEVSGTLSEMSIAPSQLKCAGILRICQTLHTQIQLDMEKDSCVLIRLIFRCCVRFKRSKSLVLQTLELFMASILLKVTGRLHILETISASEESPGAEYLILAYRSVVVRVRMVLRIVSDAFKLFTNTAGVDTQMHPLDFFLSTIPSVDVLSSMFESFGAVYPDSLPQSTSSAFSGASARPEGLSEVFAEWREKEVEIIVEKEREYLHLSYTRLKLLQENVFKSFFFKSKNSLFSTITQKKKSLQTVRDFARNVRGNVVELNKLFLSLQNLPTVKTVYSPHNIFTGPGGSIFFMLITRACQMEASSPLELPDTIEVFEKEALKAPELLEVLAHFFPPDLYIYVAYILIRHIGLREVEKSGISHTYAVLRNGAFFHRARIEEVLYAGLSAPLEEFQAQVHAHTTLKKLAWSIKKRMNLPVLIYIFTTPPSMLIREVFAEIEKLSLNPEHIYNTAEIQTKISTLAQLSQFIHRGVFSQAHLKEYLLYYAQATPSTRPELTRTPPQTPTQPPPIDYDSLLDR
ncbi:hypothetical protein NEDG_00504 [Nematocida displodere]|uniref:Uncharacterized protein n=1 Tax=Nematocida displodere TaxID=1805483 RepID=A0A177EM19_9MICR|nr:hypothetical protein NEDG_00504 [Nematocida displodere]